MMIHALFILAVLQLCAAAVIAAGLVLVRSLR
jgi:hypothetical protein